MAGTMKHLQHHVKWAQRRQKWWALALIVPLFIFVLFSFLWPIGMMLSRSVENSIVADTLPLTIVALEDWTADGGEPPPAAYLALLQDMTAAVAGRTHNQLGSRLNYEESGMASLFRRTGRGVQQMDSALVTQAIDFAADKNGLGIVVAITARDALIAMDSRWASPRPWTIIKTHAAPLTDGYFLQAIDLRRSSQGIDRQPVERRIMLRLFLRTFVMSLVITVACLLLGYPLAYLLAESPPGRANLLLILVLLPFWTSLLVRTSAWKVLLQQQGVVNDILVWLGLVADAERLVMINNHVGTIIAMTHILLPFMILPLYSVMGTIPRTLSHAARSLGASSWAAFWRVYFPQSVPGIGAGTLLVFILAMGYYITPEIVGGTSGVFISNRIAYHISTSLNWGLAAALGVILLVTVLVLYWAYDRILGAGSLRLG